VEELLEYRSRLLDHFSAVAGDFEHRLAGMASDELHEPLISAGKSRHWLLAHLRSTEEHLFLVSLQRILTETRPLLDEFDREAWMRAHYDPQEAIEMLLSSFANIRQQELDCLHNMPSDGWIRIGRHPIWGDRTLQWWVEMSQAHAVSHLRQMDG
jgi:hypothetical protein